MKSYLKAARCRISSLVPQMVASPSFNRYQRLLVSQVP